MPAKPHAKMTATAKRNYDELFEVMSATLLTFRHPNLVQTILPSEWRDIDSRPKSRKARLTLRVDEDVLRFYRKLGTGYQKQMNAVLRSFMLARLSEILTQDSGVEFATRDNLTEHEELLETQLMDMLDIARRTRLGLRG